MPLLQTVIKCSSPVIKNNVRPNEKMYNDKSTTSHLHKDQKGMDSPSLNISQEEIEIAEESAESLYSVNNEIISSSHMKLFASKMRKKVVFDKISKFCQGQTFKIFKKGKSQSLITKNNGRNEISFEKNVHRNIKDQLILIDKASSYSKMYLGKCRENKVDKFTSSNQAPVPTEFQSTKSTYNSLVFSPRCHNSTQGPNSCIFIDSMNDCSSTIFQEDRGTQTTRKSPSITKICCRNELSFDKIVNRNVKDQLILIDRASSYSKVNLRKYNVMMVDKFTTSSQSLSRARARLKKTKSASNSLFSSQRSSHIFIASMDDFKKDSIIFQEDKELQTSSPSFLKKYFKKYISYKYTTRHNETQSLPTTQQSLVSQACRYQPRNVESSKSVGMRKGHIKPFFELTRPPFTEQKFSKYFEEPKLLCVDGIHVPVKDKNAVMSWDDYQRLDVIYSFLHDLEKKHPTYCSVFNIGKTIENRDIELIAISNSNAKNHSVWLDAGIHGREWIAPAVCTYIINQLCQNFKNHPTYITNKDWYIVPVLNPDGYEYSHTKNRMWRKNRSRYKKMIGIDLNRNFSEGWQDTYDKPGHLATNYGGPAPFSEYESMAVRDMLINNGIKYSIYISLHCYGQMIMFPYSYKRDLCENYVHLLEGATQMCKGIYSVTGRNYKTGISMDVMHGAHGTSTDWAYEVAKIPFCYTIELRNKMHRFHLPADQIVDCGKEILTSICALMKYFDDTGCALVNKNRQKSPSKFFR